MVQLSLRTDTSASRFGSAARPAPASGSGRAVRRARIPIAAMSGSPQASRHEQAGRLPGTMDREGPSDPVDAIRPFRRTRLWSRALPIRAEDSKGLDFGAKLQNLRELAGFLDFGAVV